MLSMPSTTAPLDIENVPAAGTMAEYILPLFVKVPETSMGWVRNMLPRFSRLPFTASR